MRIVVIGAGALGGSFGGRLAEAGADVTLVDARADHVQAIQQAGLKVDGKPRPIQVRLPAATPQQAKGPFDVALVASDTNGTLEVAKLAAELLAPDGFALTLQNGIGNVEHLNDRLGKARVIGGSTMCSFAYRGPGHVDQTHSAPTTIGEQDGSASPRATALKAQLEAAGYEMKLSSDIMATIWTKFIVNCSINPLCATTGLRVGEVPRLPEMDRFQGLILDEIFQVIRAKGYAIDEAALRASIRHHTWEKFSKPSMLQHMEAGRRTEVDALNGALLREAAQLGLTLPYNEALVALLKGRELHEMRRVQVPPVDYDELERTEGSQPRP